MENSRRGDSPQGVGTDHLPSQDATVQLLSLEPMPPRHRPVAHDDPWEIGLEQMQDRITPAGEAPYHPLLALVVDSQGLVIGHGTARPDAASQALREAITQARDLPARGFGSGRQPDRIVVDHPALIEWVREHFPDVPIGMGPTPRLEEALNVFASVFSAEKSGGSASIGLTSYLQNGISADAAAGFFEAAAALYKQKPWRQFVDQTCLFRITCNALDMRQWVGMAVGQLGEAYGILVFESLDDFDNYLIAAGMAATTGTMPPGLLPVQRAISWEPMNALSAGLLEEIEAHGWAVPADDGYPVPMLIESNASQRAITSTELSRLELIARSLSRLLEQMPNLAEIWNTPERLPITKRFSRVAAGGMEVPVTLTLLEPIDDA